MSELSGVTIIIPTLNRGDFLLDCLRDLIAQKHRPLEILVVDQSKVIPEAVQVFSSQHLDLISYHQVSFRGLPQARNYGWQNAQYEALIYIDDDTRCPPNLVSEHLQALQQPGVGAAAGRVIEVNREDIPAKRAGEFDYWTATPKHGFHMTGEYETDAVLGANFSTWKAIVREIGGFDEQLSIGAALYEETDFSLRVGKAGYTVYFNSRAMLKHLASPSGGCRVDGIEEYIHALAHNRTILIRRHLRWYQRPTAFLELMRLGLAYAVAYRKIEVLSSLLKGYRAAMKTKGAAQ